MKFFPRFYPLLVAVCLCLFPAHIAFAGDEWRAIDPAELALKTSTVEKDADAEVLFWEVRIDDSQPAELVLKNYIRIKVFNDRGKESQSKVDLPYVGSAKIRDIAARVIKPDGTIAELKKADVFDRTLVKASGVKYKAKSFALPGVEVGSIIEYQWQEVHPNGSANRLRLQFQREIPIEQVTYFLKPFAGMRYNTFHMESARFVKDKNDFYRISQASVPAYHEEPSMPPENEVRASVFLYFSEEEKLDVDKYWKTFGKAVADGSKDEMKVSDDIKSAVITIIGDASTPDQKLERIYDYCRTKIKNINDDASGLTEDDKKKIKDNKNPSDTYKHGIGTGGDIDMLFAALAKAAGFDAHLALSGNRDDLFFDRRLVNGYLLGSSFIAVKVGEGWKFFSPAEMYTTFGMLGWPEEGQDTLITDSKEPIWVKTPLSPPEKSIEKRTGRFRLLEDGTLEGDVRIEYSGHLGYDKKEYNDDDSPTQREQTLLTSIKERMSTAEVTNIKVENVNDPIKLFTYTYHIRVPGYAQRTGKRLFLQPSFFEHGKAPRFTTSDRKQDIFFRYTWSESDEIFIELPVGFSLDNADAPAPITGATTANITGLEIKIGISKDNRELGFTRKFFFGGGDNVIFPTTYYGPLKNLFDAYHKNDEHTITLKQTSN